MCLARALHTPVSPRPTRQRRTGVVYVGEDGRGEGDVRERWRGARVAATCQPTGGVGWRPTANRSNGHAAHTPGERLPAAVATAAAFIAPAASWAPHKSQSITTLCPPHRGRPATRHVHCHRGSLLLDPIEGGGGTSWEAKQLARSPSAAWEGHPPRGAHVQPSMAFGSTSGRVVRGTGACDTGALAERCVRQSRSRCSLLADRNGDALVKKVHQ